jgi:hypothetical protein
VNWQPVGFIRIKTDRCVGTEWGNDNLMRKMLRAETYTMLMLIPMVLLGFIGKES